MDEILQKTISYGTKHYLQPKLFEGFGKEDSIQFLQIENHCFVILYLAKTKAALVSDGENAFSKSHYKSIILEQMKGIRSVKYLPFNAQMEKNQCASSAAAIGIEFQRIHKQGHFPEKEIIVAPSILENIRKVLHKERGEKLNKWKSIKDWKPKIECPNCHKPLKHRGVLAIHKFA